MGSNDLSTIPFSHQNNALQVHLKIGPLPVGAAFILDNFHNRIFIQNVIDDIL